jgi:hypothetical protein
MKEFAKLLDVLIEGLEAPEWKRTEAFTEG